MAVMKPDPEVEITEVDTAVNEIEAATASAPVVKKPAKPKTVKPDDTAFCVYLGPTIHGVIQSGTVYNGNRASTEAALAVVIEKYPMIAKLIVTDKTLAEDRVKVKTAGNALNVFYKKLASGKSI